jgi:plasmid stabilization system protein ParE
VFNPRKPYRIHDQAVLDLRLAARWYSERRRGLGAEFVLAVDAAIAKIIEAPGRWPLFAGARRYILKRFPDNVIYRVNKESIHILAIAQHSRRPVYWGRPR